MKIRNISNWLIVSVIILCCLSGFAFVFSILKQSGPVIVLAIIAVLASLYGCFYLCVRQITFRIDMRGIEVVRLGSVQYFIPWKEIKTIGIRKGFRGALILYVSRLDAENTGAIMSKLVQTVDMEKESVTINSCIIGKNTRNAFASCPILILNENASGNEYETLRKLQTYASVASEK